MHISGKERQSNIELLRIVLMLGVIILHYNYAGIGGGFRFVESRSINFYILYYLESVFICSVNLFFMISGYFMIGSKKRTIRKPLELILQVIIYSLTIQVMSSIVHKTLDANLIISSLIPSNYFVIFYVVLYILSPYINIILERLNEQERSGFIVALLVLFSVYTTAVMIISNAKGERIIGLDSTALDGNQNGYNIVNFSTMYIIGAYIKTNKIKQKEYSKAKLVLCFVLCSLMIFFWGLIDYFTPNKTYKIAWCYSNPFVIMEAIVLFLLFLNTNIGSNKRINVLAKGAFSVFLLHGFFVKKISIESFVKKSPIMMIGHIMLTTVGIYLICTIIGLLYQAIMTPLFNRVFQHKNCVIIDLEKNNEN